MTTKLSLSERDRFEIMDLYARYCFLADGQDSQGWAECFTEDGLFDQSDYYRDAPAKVELQGAPCSQGRAEIIRHHSNPARLARRVRHWNSSIVLDGRESFVEGKCYALLLLLDEVGNVSTNASITYYDEIVKADGKWYFRVRKPVKDYR